MCAALLRDREFSSTVLRLAIPIAAQQLVMNALNAVDILMVGQLGETAVAAVGLANQVFFLMSLFLFGVGSGSAIFTAQFWGRGDVAGLRRVLGLALGLGLLGSGLFSAAALAFPERVLRLYTGDPVVVALGASYLRTVGICYVPIAVSVMYGMVLRSTRHVQVPMVVSISALSLKTVLAYALIFGQLGAPALGVVGAAVATCVARFLECVVLLSLTYGRRLPPAAKLREMLGHERRFLARYARTTLPVVLGEVLWSLGITTYAAVYARISTESVAAVNIAGTIEGIALVPFLGLGNACAIILGNRIGAGDPETADNYARRFLVVAVAGGVAVGLLMFLASRSVLDLYRVSEMAQDYGRAVLAVLSAVLWLKAANLIMIVGIMRSGADTRFALFADTAPLWLIGVPLALLGAFVFRLPVYWVVLLVVTDEAAKFIISTWRVLTRRWINNVIA